MASIIIVSIVFLACILLVFKLIQFQKKLVSAIQKAERRNDFCILQNDHDQLLTRSGYSFSSMSVAKYFHITVEPGLYTVLLPKGYYLVSTSKFLELNHEGVLHLSIIDKTGHCLHTFVRVKYPPLRR